MNDIFAVKTVYETRDPIIKTFAEDVLSQIEKAKFTREQAEAAVEAIRELYQINESRASKASPYKFIRHV